MLQAIKKRYLLDAVLILTGYCIASTAYGDESGINVTSIPAGASVYASGKLIGKTPTFLSAETFPTKLKGLVYRPVGTLTIKKSGCKVHDIDVNTKVLSKDIHVPLECGPQYVEEAITPAEGPGKAGRGSVRSRLLELNALHRDGLISDEEYKAIRKRILDDL